MIGHRLGQHSLLRYVLQRTGSALLTLAIISVLLFVSLAALGGDAASVLLGRTATPAVLAEARSALGLDRPMIVQYLSWVWGVLHGDLGYTASSILAKNPQSIGSLIKQPAINSAILAVVTFVLITPLAMALGVVAGLKPGSRWDRILSGGTLGLASVPEFVAGTFLIYVFFYQLHLFPPVSLVPPGTTPLDRPTGLVLPVLTLGAGILAIYARHIRASVMEVSTAPFVQAARLNGYRESVVLRRFILRNSLIPSVHVAALVVIYLFGGVIIVEEVFAYPGIGKFLVDAVVDRDFRIVEAIAMLVAIVCVIASLLADLLTLFLSPKLRGSL